VEEDLNRPDFPVKTITTPIEAMAGMEWAIPTVVIAYLLKPFFESALQEAGKDSYQYAKKRLKAFIVKNRQVKTRRITAKQSTQKLSRNYNQSNTISLKAWVHSGLIINVLFDEQAKEKDLEDMLDGMFDSIHAIYIHCQNQNPEDPPKKGMAKEVYFLADLERKSWEMLTTKQMIDRFNQDL